MSRSDTSSRVTFTRAAFSICALVASSTALLGVTAYSIAVGAEQQQAAVDSTTVKIINFTFNPKAVRVPVGTTITWTNDDDIGHTVASVGSRLFRSKTMDTEDKYSFTFTQAGTYEYRCTLHANMTGTIVVQDRTTDDKTQ